MTITYYDLITLVLTSSLIAAVMTVFGNWLLQRNNYRDDYYKKLLEKRLDAYEAVESLVGQLLQLSQLDDGRIAPIFCTLGKDYFDSFLISIMATSSKSIWLDQKTNSKITELNAFLLTKISNQIDESATPAIIDIQLSNLGAQYRDHIKNIRKELQQMLYSDIQSLHKIQPFIEKIKMKD
ncbi:MAG TPA: hypothetical protein PKV76_08285 [Chitinophagales bacterium]|jgi:hypothetical protein|nr:hypothetical protein [Chitinophagales bacterium]